jgi:hypothetical protein
MLEFTRGGEERDTALFLPIDREAVGDLLPTPVIIITNIFFLITPMLPLPSLVANCLWAVEP